ncbi:ABC transporter permease [Cetobacterium sp.]|uniref:ABC transporter permease n=1 Tax=Cetobacterium sp. TaxID=2071632 RepID=UPI003F2A17F1
MRYEIKIAYNFLMKSKWQTLFLLTAIGTGVAVQLFISSLIVSLQDNLVDTILGNIAHIIIEDGDMRKTIKKEGGIYTYGNFSNERNKISNYKNIISVLKNDTSVKNVVPTLEGNALYERSGKSIALKIRGVDLETGNSIFKVKEKVYSGKNNIESNKILIGKRVAEDFFLSPNDILSITLPNGNKENFIVNGIFDLEDAQSNNGLVYMDILKAQRIFDKRGYINKINIQLNNIFLGNEFSKKIESRYPYLKAISWMKDGKQLLNALKSQTMSSLVIQVVVLLSTTLSIASVLYITVVQKTKEIGILKAIGASDFSIGFIVLIQGATVGFLGAVLGCLLGIILIQVFQIGAKPSFIIVVKLPLILRILIFSTLSGIIAAYIPGKKSMKLNPVEVIKGE